MDKREPLQLVGGAPRRADRTAAFDALFRDEYPKLVRALAVVAGFEAAADAVQDAFVQANLHWPRVSTLDSPGAWIRRVAINRLHNHHRGLRRGDAALAKLALPTPAPDPTGLDLDLQRAIAELPERQRHAVCLHYLADLSINQVADALAVSPGTVKSNLHDARHTLERRLRVIDHA
jgi:RNA polymerase sigma-70 factor (ECF subfamily)